MCIEETTAALYELQMWLRRWFSFPLQARGNVCKLGPQSYRKDTTSWRKLACQLARKKGYCFYKDVPHLVRAVLQRNLQLHFRIPKISTAEKFLAGCTPPKPSNPQQHPWNSPSCQHSDKMANINYLLYESAAGYAIFQVVNQADSVGLQLKEVQNSLKDLATFSKHVKLVNFTPYRYG